MEWFCPQCWGEGEIAHQDIKSPIAVICAKCSYMDAYVWCERCGVGGQIASTDFNLQPLEWTCRECGNRYPLPPDFYQHPLKFRPVAIASKPYPWLSLEKRFAYISPVWLRQFVIFWEKYRMAFVLGCIGAFGILVILIILSERREFLDNIVERWVATFLFVLSSGGLALSLLLDSLTFAIAKYHERKRNAF